MPETARMRNSFRMSIRMMMVLTAAVSILLWFVQTIEEYASADVFVYIAFVTSVVFLPTTMSPKTKGRTNFFAVLTTATAGAALCALTIVICLPETLPKIKRTVAMEAWSMPAIVAGALAGAFFSTRIDRSRNIELDS